MINWSIQIDVCIFIWFFNAQKKRMNKTAVKSRCKSLIAEIWGIFLNRFLKICAIVFLHAGPQLITDNFVGSQFGLILTSAVRFLKLNRHWITNFRLFYSSNVLQKSGICRLNCRRIINHHLIRDWNERRWSILIAWWFVLWIFKGCVVDRYRIYIFLCYWLLPHSFATS